jgi:hypothetical protein
LSDRRFGHPESQMKKKENRGKKLKLTAKPMAQSKRKLLGISRSEID